MKFPVVIGFSITAIISIIVAVVAIATVSWVIDTNPNLFESNRNETNETIPIQVHIGLFSACSQRLCSNSENDLHIAAQVMTLISTLAQLVGTTCHLINECHKSKPHLIKIIATMFSLAAGAMLVGMSIFTKIYHPLPDRQNFGFSYFLGWVSFIASFVLAVVAIVQAVRDAKKFKAAYGKANTAAKEDENL